ncbi:MAG TPA: lipid-A-disaccharide synthase [Thermoanaerobaculia bacterium]|nr:lipid-A-disaccharide synthase [Thermoanaerobaculia bacterium]
MSVGEASGDMHAAGLMKELSALAPGARYFGMGGAQMRAQGLDAVADARDIAVVGITEALRVLPRARQIFGSMLTEARLRQPDAAVLVDSPDFNLRLARRLHDLRVPVVYYVSPQVWAWRPSRVRHIARNVDRMLVLFPFEVEFYRRRGVEVEHVGHPLVDEVPALPQAWDRDRGEARRLALLPGSRRSEIASLLPVMLAAAALLRQDRPDCQVRLILAPTLSLEDVAPLLSATDVPVEVVASDRHRHIADSHLALCASGTATLEVGLLGTPLIVLYRLGTITSLLARLLVRVPHIGLVNLVLGEEVAPELVQGRTRPEHIAAVASRLLADPAAIAGMRAKLSALRPALGESGASRRAASAVLQVLARSSQGSPNLGSR